MLPTRGMNCHVSESETLLAGANGTKTLREMSLRFLCGSRVWQTRRFVLPGAVVLFHHVSDLFDVI